MPKQLFQRQAPIKHAKFGSKQRIPGGAPQQAGPKPAKAVKPKKPAK